MKLKLSTRSVEIPAGIEVTVDARDVSIKGPRGLLTRSFKHVQMGNST
jgi:large subunit ribosomal protein L9e